MSDLWIDDKLVGEMTSYEKELLRELRNEKASYENSNNPPFSLLITENLPAEIPNHTLIYVVRPQIIVNETNVVRCLVGQNAVQEALQLAILDYRNRKKNILLYLGKFPGYGFDIDGGSILARQLITSLKIRCNLTVCFIRKNEETFEDHDVVKVQYVTYQDPWNNKFIRRLENLETNYEALKDYSKYDVVLAGHISKFFGMERAGRDFWKKAIIFPMFCTSSYERAGESVPREYTEQEQIVIDNVEKIITPSNDEKNDLIADYNCDESKISVISRGISPLIKYKTRQINGDHVIKIVCIGTIKTQKNTKLVLDLLQLLTKKSYSFEIHLVATIQDKEYYEEFCRLIKENELSEYVKYHISIPQEELAELLEEMDFNISMSSWETFGRGIFEGASAGLPTIVFEVLKTVKELAESNKGICFISSLEEMADKIISLIDNPDVYREMSLELASISRKFSYKNEQNLLMQEILSLGE